MLELRIRLAGKGIAQRHLGKPQELLPRRGLRKAFAHPGQCEVPDGGGHLRHQREFLFGRHPPPGLDLPYLDGGIRVVRERRGVHKGKYEGRRREVEGKKDEPSAGTRMRAIIVSVGAAIRSRGGDAQ